MFPAYITSKCDMNMLSDRPPNQRKVRQCRSLANGPLALSVTADRYITADIGSQNMGAHLIFTGKKPYAVNVATMINMIVVSAKKTACFLALFSKNSFKDCVKSYRYSL